MPRRKIMYQEGCTCRVVAEESNELLHGSRSNIPPSIKGQSSVIGVETYLQPRMTHVVKSAPTRLPQKVKIQCRTALLVASRCCNTAIVVYLVPSVYIYHTEVHSHTMKLAVHRSAPVSTTIVMPYGNTSALIKRATPGALSSSCSRFSRLQACSWSTHPGRRARDNG
jgi:hypothetical protein